MSDEFGWDFSGAADAKAEIRLAVEYLLAGAIGTARGDIVREIIESVRDAANGQPPDPPGRVARRLVGGKPCAVPKELPSARVWEGRWCVVTT